MVVQFRVFVVRHENGSYTLTLPGVEEIDISDAWYDVVIPATSTLTAHGLVLDELKEELAEAAAKRLARAEPYVLGTVSNFREGQYLEKVDVEIRPDADSGKKRRNKITLTMSLMIVKEPDGQLLVTVPKFTDPELSFYVFDQSELAPSACIEIAQYLDGASLEEVLAYRYERQEFLDTIEVRFKPLSAKDERKKKSEEDDTHFWAIRSCGTNLTARVRENKLGHAYGRENEVADLLAILASDTAASVLLTGPSGVGKTALAHEIARRIKGDKCPEPLRNRQVWATSPSQLISGCSHIGEWEEKLKNVVDEVKKRRHILVIEDVVGLMEAGKWSKGDENMARYLKPYLADDTVTIIAETSPERYAVGEKTDPAFLAQFRRFVVDETNSDRTASILVKVSADLERRRHLRIEPGALDVAIELTRRFQPYRTFPGKAISFLERAAADVAGKKEQNATIGPAQAVTAFAHQTGLPEFLISDSMPLEPVAVQRHFSERLIGQPDAVNAMVDLIAVIKAGLNDPNKPLGVLFLVGPTGVGKTELAKVLAEYLFGNRERMLRFDMTEYAESMTISKLIGSTFSSEEGDLTKKIRLNPFSVVLLDEFEKANPSVFDVMLQVLGEGRLTDAAGRTADFRSSVVLMTSNLGASAREQRQFGLRSDDASTRLEAHFRKQVEKFFRPEFINRLDRIVVFSQLDRDAVRAIAMREIDLLFARDGIVRRRLLVQVEPPVIDRIVESGFNSVYGARPLKREIERRIITPLARYLVAHRIGASQVLTVALDGDAIRIDAASLSSPKQRGIVAPGALSGAASAQLTPAAMAEEIANLRIKLQRLSDGDRVSQIVREYRKLLARTRQKTFVSYGVDAHKIWKRIYGLERLTKRLEQLKQRAEYLEEFVLLAIREPVDRYASELANSYVDLKRDVEYLQIELLCVDSSDAVQAVLTVAPMGRTARTPRLRAWIAELASMYVRWAKRKGYEIVVSAPVAPYTAWAEKRGLTTRTCATESEITSPDTVQWTKIDTTDIVTLLKWMPEMESDEFQLSLAGVNIFGFLRGESGVHKRIDRDEDRAGTAPYQAAVVSVLKSSDKDEMRAQAPTADSSDSNAPLSDTSTSVVRVYSSQGERYVRDLRTGAETNRVKDFLDGQIDDFILAYLMSTEADSDWAGL